jgi:hypothetical protein
MAEDLKQVLQGLIGNTIYINDAQGGSTNFTTGWYEITAYTDTNTVTIDRTAADPGTDASGGWGAIGGALLFSDANFEGWTAGNKGWVKTGTYSPGAISVAKDGTLAVPMVLEGYNSSRGDDPTGTDRPLINAAANDFGFDDYWVFEDLRGTTTSANGFNCDTACQMTNVKFENSSTTSFRDALQGGGNGRGRFISVEASSIEGDAMSPGGSAFISNSYVRDSNARCLLWSNNDRIFVENTIFDTCYRGAIFTTGNVNIVFKNVLFANSIVGIEFSSPTADEAIIFLNNIFYKNIDGITADNGGTEPGRTQMFFDYNLWNGNTRDMSWDNGATEDNDPKGDNAVSSDPTFNITVNSGSTGSTNPAGTTLTISAIGGVDTDDAVRISAGTGATIGIYDITGISGNDLTIDRSAGSSATNISYSIVEGEDFTVQSGSPVLDAGIQPGTDIGLTGDYKHNIGPDQDDNTAGGGETSCGFVF